MGTITDETIHKAKDILYSIKKLWQEKETNDQQLSHKQYFLLATKISELTSDYLELIPTIGNT